MMALQGRGDADVGILLASYSPEVREIVQRLRRLVLGMVPDAIEQIDLPARMLAYGFARTYRDMICTIMPQKAWVNLGFPRGAEMSDPAGKLTGTGKRARHVKVMANDDTNDPVIRLLVEQAVGMVGKRSSA